MLLSWPWGWGHPEGPERAGPPEPLLGHPYENSTRYRDKAQRNGFLRPLPLKTRKQKKRAIVSTFFVKFRFLRQIPLDIVFFAF